MGISRYWSSKDARDLATEVLDEGYSLHWKKCPDIILFSECSHTRPGEEFIHTQFISDAWPAGHKVVVVGHCCGALRESSRKAMREKRPDIDWVFPDSVSDFGDFEVTPDAMLTMLEDAGLVELVKKS